MILKNLFMTRILVTGANGQLGKSFQYCASDNPEFYFVYKDRSELDISNLNQLRGFFQNNKINIVINCAAYTDVDQAEKEIEKAKRINTHAIKALCDLSQEYQFKLIHFSTDYVFDGTSKKPYDEMDLIGPLGVYGRTKAAGEKVILSSSQNMWIIRTSWLFSPFGENFAKKIFSLLQIKDKINVISDQMGSPTYALDLARDILKVLSKNISNKEFKFFHYANTGQTTWHGFASKIKVLCKSNCIVNPVKTSFYKTLAKRPKYSVLCCEKFKKEFNLNPQSWELALEDCLIKIRE